MKNLVYFILLVLLTTSSCKKKEACDGVICQNGGSCVDGVCVCVNGYTGSQCQIDPVHIDTFRIPCYGLTNPKAVMYIEGTDTGLYIYDTLGRVILDSLTRGVIKNRITYLNDSTISMNSQPMTHSPTQTWLNSDGFPKKISQNGAYAYSFYYSSPGRLDRITITYPSFGSPYTQSIAMDTIVYDNSDNITRIHSTLFTTDFHQPPVQDQGFSEYNYYSYDYYGEFEPLRKFYLSIPQLFSKSLIRGGDSQMNYTYTFNANGYVSSITYSNGSTKYIYYDCE
jgi:hypothetical protein